MTTFCRDCLGMATDPAASRCLSCGSPRVVRANPDLWVAHIDCDAFYASVEKRDRPELAQKPLIVGGGLTRGVVSTACYIARISGVRSAMPMAQALRLCPNAVVVKPDFTKYSAVSRAIRERMSALTPLVEPLSIDEAFLDLAGCEAALGLPVAVALARLALEVERDLGVTISVGLSYCKFLAKLASDLDKPRGFAVLSREDAVARLAPMEIGRLWGVGKVAEARLGKLGFTRIGDLQTVTEAEATARIGEDGRRLWRLARGIDARKVSLGRASKSVSAETTFDVDIADRDELEAILLGLCEKVALRLKQQALAAGGVTLKLRLPDFRLRTRARVLAPTQLAPRLFAAGRALLATEPTGQRYRLIGIGATDLRPAADADAGDLVEGDRVREKARESAIDALRERFGRGAVVRGLAFRGRGEA